MSTESGRPNGRGEPDGKGRSRDSSSAVPAISLFSGAGGLDLGFARAGFDIRVAVEIDPAAVATLRRNWRDTTVITRPLEELSTGELLEHAGLTVGGVGVLFGGPPCQSFCIAGNGRGLGDPRGQLLFEFCRVVREAQPRVFLIENVPGLLRVPRIVEAVHEAVNRGAGPEYNVSHDILDAAEYGVPQRRKRVFFVGWKGPGDYFFPRPTHQMEGGPQRTWLKPAVTAGQALAGLPEPDLPSAVARRVARTIPERNRKWYGK